MKIEYLRKIIARVQSQIHCPKCKGAFAEEHIEIKMVKGNHVEFSADCAHCKSRSQISAEINGPSVEKAQSAVMPSVPVVPKPVRSSKLEPSVLEAMKHDLQAFKGQDIRSLFE